MRKFAVVALAVMLAGPAFAKAPEPKKPVEIDRLMGRWYEILRTPNAMQKNCYGAYQVWARSGPDKFSIMQTCHKDSLDGETKSTPTTAKVVDPGTNAKFEASFFGGIIKQQYWMLDHDDGYSWMIASTSGGNFVSLLARKPVLPAAEIEAHKERIAAMGLRAERLVAMGAK